MRDNQHRHAFEAFRNGVCHLCVRSAHQLTSVHDIEKGAEMKNLTFDPRMRWLVLAQNPLTVHTFIHDEDL